MLSLNQWESDFFSRKIYNLDTASWDATAFTRRITDLKPDLVAARVPLEEASVIGELTSRGFVIADTALDFARRVDEHTATGTDACETATAGDIEALEQIAEEAIIHSRFDNSVFGDRARQRLYAQWVANAVSGEFDDICLLDRTAGKVTGFVTCRKESNDCCRIGLLAVRPGFRGKGIGNQLIAAARRYAAARDCGLLRVSTQYGNRPAVGLYSGTGFALDTIDLWLYRS
jgi:dTDP-4-amino-4,6-dideoxy-D-galactose acyltransferase